MNNQKKTYKVSYVCDNCNYVIYKNIPCGTRIPLLVSPDNPKSKYNFVPEMPAPECPRCGCRDWLYGKVV